jgi:hypothetical protein
VGGSWNLDNEATVTVKDWLHIAFSPPVVRRGLKYAVFVGGILIGINHGDAILRQEVDSGRLTQMALTVLVPYLVSTSSSVSAIREFNRRDSAD